MIFMKSAGYRKAFLLTASGLDKAASLYRRYGFIWKGETPAKAFNQPASEIRYELVLD